MGQPICMLFPGEDHFSLSKFSRLPIVFCVGFRGPCGSGGADYQSQRIRGLVVKWCCLVMSEKLITKNYLLFWNRIDIYYVPWSYPPLSHPFNAPPKPYYTSSSQPHVRFLPHFCLFASVPALDCRPATGHHFVPEPTKEDLRIR